MADWHWEYDPDDLPDGLPPEATAEAARLAQEIATRDSMVFLDGASYAGPNPGLRTECGGHVMLTYLTDVRGERIVVVQVTWFG
ncbi:hypothetical protein ABZ442_07110 [Streptomyces triculaminicus]|uniref:hypothetical protein n=1 Tax=Streptomyces triculaminicus TaxID=2816232 RepID=UPI0033C2B829